MEDRSYRCVRILLALLAGRGLDVNEIACALISMVAREDDTLQYEAGYIYGQPRLRKGNLVLTVGRLQHLSGLDRP
jgi:hypothetical protein